MKKVIEHLERLGKGLIQPEDLTEGICVEIKTHFGGEVMAQVIDAMDGWTRNSGIPLFPVPCPWGGCPKARYESTENLWRTGYGDYRRDLCLYLSRSI